jgi:hypothetical protein
MCFKRSHRADQALWVVDLVLRNIMIIGKGVDHNKLKDTKHLKINHNGETNTMGVGVVLISTLTAKKKVDPH